MQKTKTSTVSARVEPILAEKLSEAVRKSKGRNRSYFINEALKMYFASDEFEAELFESKLKAQKANLTESMNMNALLKQLGYSDGEIEQLLLETGKAVFERLDQNRSGNSRSVDNSSDQNSLKSKDRQTA